MPSPPEAPSLLDPVVTLHVGDGSSSVGGKNLLGDKGRLSSVTGLCLVENFSSSSPSRPARVLQQRRARRPGGGAALAGTESDSAGESGRDEDDDSSDDDDEPIQFQCRQLAATARRDVDLAPFGEWRGRRLVSCHANGEAFVWDLERQRIENELCAPRGGPGLALRRMASMYSCDEVASHHVAATFGSRVMYQTRDQAGTVSLHQFQPDGTITQLQAILTQSQSFCAASPCANHPDLIVVPDGDETAAVVRDVRAGPAAPPAAVLCTSQIKPPSSSSLSASPSLDRTYGMLTSLAFAMASRPGLQEKFPCDEVFRLPQGGSGRPVVACGMESGHVLLYDVAATSTAQPVSVASPLDHHDDAAHATTPSWFDVPSAFVSLGKDPVLALDMVPSFFSASRNDSPLSLVMAAGMAGTLEDVAALDRAEQGRVAVVKCRWAADDSAWTARIRSRFATCRIPSDRAASHPGRWIGRGGKPGVSQCRFRPGPGRLLAVAGWDRRVRVFDRSAKASRGDARKGGDDDRGSSSAGGPSSHAALAVLRGHATTVSAIDWASDAEASGLLASGGNDGRIHVWRLDL